AFALLELVAEGAVAVGGEVVEAILEIGPQVEAGTQPPDAGLALAVVAAPGPVAGQAVAEGLAAGRWIERAEAIDRAAGDGALGDLVGRGPPPAVGHAGHRPAVVAAALAVAQHAVELAIVLVDLPGAVVVKHFQAVEQVAIAELWRTGEQAACVAVLTEGQFGQIGIELAEVVDVGRAGRGEI